MIQWTNIDPNEYAPGYESKNGYSDFRIYRTQKRSYRIHKHSGGVYHLVILARDEAGNDVMVIFENWGMQLAAVEEQIETHEKHLAEKAASRP